MELETLHDYSSMYQHCKYYTASDTPLEFDLQGHSRSNQLTHVDFPYANSYQCLTVTYGIYDVLACKGSVIDGNGKRFMNYSGAIEIN